MYAKEKNVLASLVCGSNNMMKPWTRVRVHHYRRRARERESIISNCAFSCLVTPCVVQGRYLVDPASSHMLVSKIKPCMSKYKSLYGETANGSLNQL